MASRHQKQPSLSESGNQGAGSAPLPITTISIFPSLSAPDAWIAFLVLAFLQYKQHNRRRKQKNARKKMSVGTKKPKTSPSQSSSRKIWSFVHGWLFTNLLVLTSPLSNMASNLNAEVIDLKSEEELNRYAQDIATGKSSAPSKKKSKSSGDGGSSERRKAQTREVRTRRIRSGELVWNNYFPALETVLNVALALIVGLLCRWIFGLFRALRLSSASPALISPSGPGGPCCSPYRGGDDEGTRLPGSFERLLACVLVKGEGDSAGSFFFTLLLLALFVCVVQLAWLVSAAKRKHDEDEDLSDDESDNDAVGENNGKSKNEGKNTFKRVDRATAKRYFVWIGSTLASLWLFHTPALLRLLGLIGLVDATEELSARVLLFFHLVGFTSLPEVQILEEPPAQLQNLMNIFFILLAVGWGYISSGMMVPIQEMARYSACLLSPSLSSKGKKAKIQPSPEEMLELINVRIMLIIQAIAPFVILCTYLFESRFAGAIVSHSQTPGAGAISSASKRYLQNSGLFVRLVLSWCFIASSIRTFRSLIQSFLDQAATVASAMASMGESVTNPDSGRSASRGVRRGQVPLKSSSLPTPMDPFSDRYSKVVLTAGRIVVFPIFIFALLATAHLRGGDGSTHPGIGYEPKPHGTPREFWPGKGLLPPYSGHAIAWIANGSGEKYTDVLNGDALLRSAKISHFPWYPTPFRDATQRKIVEWFGKSRFCKPPEVRSIKALERHVNYLLENSDDESDSSSFSETRKTNEVGNLLTINAMTGRELLDMAPPLPTTLFKSLLGHDLHQRPVGATKNCVNPILKSDDGDDLSSYANNNDIVLLSKGAADECEVQSEMIPPVHAPTTWQIVASLVSHNFLTPTVVRPIVDSLAFLSSVWGTYWYTLGTFSYWNKLRGSAFLKIIT